MIWLILGIVLWFVCGLFAVRMYFYDEVKSQISFTFAIMLFLFGVFGLIMALFAAKTANVRKAFFLKPTADDRDFSVHFKTLFLRFFLIKD